MGCQGQNPKQFACSASIGTKGKRLSFGFVIGTVQFIACGLLKSEPLDSRHGLGKHQSLPSNGHPDIC